MALSMVLVISRISAFVFHQKNRLVALGMFSRESFSEAGVAPVEGKKIVKPFPERDAGNIDEPFVLFDDSETMANPVPSLFPSPGREERLEEVAQVFSSIPQPVSLTVS